MDGSLAGNCTSSALSQESGFLWLPCSLLPISLTVIQLPSSCGKSRLKCDLSWVIVITILLSCERRVSRMIVSLLPPNMAAILILMMGSRFGASSTSCVRSPLRISMSTLRASLMDTDRFPPKVSSLPNASLWGLSLSINLLCSTVLRMTWASVSGSKLFLKPPEYL